MKLVQGKEIEVGNRMLDVLSRFGFTQHEDHDDHTHWSRSNLYVYVRIRRAEQFAHDPVVARVYTFGGEINAAFNARGLSNIIRNHFNQDHTPTPESDIATSPNGLVQGAVCSACGLKLTRVNTSPDLTNPMPQWDDWSH